MSPNITIIQDASALASLCERLADAPRIALDTEFHAERRYRPELMLLQLAVSAEEAWLVDPKAVHPAPLGPVLSEAEVIVHGGQQDIRILNELTGWVPRKIFDTQIGAGLLGIHYPERLSTLAALLLGLPLDKSPTLTDWSSRPLSKQQLRYAADDAVILLALREALEARLAEVERSEWAWTASAEMAAGVLAPAHPSSYWASWEVATRMAPIEWHTLGVLREWREDLAVQQSRPPHAVLPNGILIDLARRRPSSRRGLTANRRVHSGFVRHNGAALLQVIADAEAKPAPPPPPTWAERDVADALVLWGRAAGARAQIAPRLLMPEELAAEIARDGVGAVRESWRASFQGALEKFLSGASGVVLSTDGESTPLKMVEL